MQVATEPSLKTTPAVDGDAWNRFVTSRSEANLCHAWEWKQVIERTYAKTCHYIQVTEGTRCVGVLPLVHMRGPLTGNRLVSVPFLDQGGPIAASEEARKALRDACLDLAGHVRATGVDIRGPGFQGGSVATSENGDPSPRVTFTLPLSEDPEVLWKSFRSKVRNQVRKAEKEGLTTERVDPGRLGAFYDVFCRNMRDLGSPVHARTLFASIFEAFGDRARLYLTMDGAERVVGGAIAIEFESTVTVPWASALRSARPSCPNHSLYWKILSDAAGDGKKLFDFGRSRVGAGTYSFKKQWGAEARGLVWSSFDLRGEPEEGHDYDPDRHARVVRAWQRLPVAVTKLIGPIIRRQLAN